MFNWSSRAWSIGPSLSLPIFAGGRNRANYRRSQAVYEESVANYRQRVLVAFGEVEDSLSGIRHLTDQSAAQQRAVTNARRAADHATDRYRSGLVSYIEVVDVSRDALQAERGSAQLTGQRLIAAVQLVKALGGGWNRVSSGPFQHRGGEALTFASTEAVFEAMERTTASVTELTLNPDFQLTFSPPWQDGRM